MTLVTHSGPKLVVACAPTLNVAAYDINASGRILKARISNFVSFSLRGFNYFSDFKNAHEHRLAALCATHTLTFNGQLFPL